MESTLKVYTTGYCSKEEFRRHCEYFQPCLFQHVHRHDSLFSLNPFNSPAIRKAVAENVVDISCSSSREFAGHPMKRTKTNLQLSEFLSAFDNVDRLPVDENLFLSQCCVHSTDPEEIEVIELEEFALSMLPLVIPRSDLQSINIWANTKASFSSLHYDANHNILVVAQGKKTLYLLPPSVTEHLEPFSAFLESPNHSNLNSTQFQAIFSSKSDISSFSSLIRVEVSAGEAVFIPEGWWHAVESNDQTVAFNFWFLSPLQRFLTSNTHMMPYVLRATAHALGSAKQSEVLGSSSSRDFEVNKVHGSSLSQSLQMAQNLLEQELLPACESLGSFRIVWNKFANEEVCIITK